MFHVGQMVECVDDRPVFFPVSNVIKGAVYTVTGVLPPCPWNDGWGLTLAGTQPAPGSAGFRAERFRPLQDSKLEVFRALLVDLPALPKFEPTKEGV